ncbi:hypothetical protein AVU25_gp80 [Pseudomonas phage DL64]|uniref:Uncharacterized protein n=1 Tax=Pseudomonas phage DL64 TaxID=1640973 RepID=A0A0F6YQK9_9CAUD|nr:hypothetical protein AVU25_gp80 [Pseudomonas phage DL64]AKF14050.1 hypothetical protein [Pseudomonas phage DL64]
MRTVAQLIKLGLEYYVENKSPPYMCYVLCDMFERQQITLEERTLCKEWVYEKIPSYSPPIVLGYLKIAGLPDTKENWFQFFVWAYYDLIKRNHHEHQP